MSDMLSSDVDFRTSPTFLRFSTNLSLAAAVDAAIFALVALISAKSLSASLSLRADLLVEEERTDILLVVFE